MLLMMFDRDIEYVREKMRERERDVCSILVHSHLYYTIAYKSTKVGSKTK